jgi:pyruvate dehydrogenase E2 component (dihydrolipoamide acetyltransferase)
MDASESLQRGSCTLAFETSPAPVGERSTIVLLHGFGMSRHAMRPLAECLQASCGEARTIALDLRGHGDTRSPETDQAHDYPSMRDDVLALLDHCAAPNAHLVGHSMGGQIALMAAAARPERVRSLSLIGAGPCRAVTSEREEKSWLRAAAAFETSSPEQLATSLTAAAPTDDPKLTPETLYGRARGPDLARIVRGGFLTVESNDDACRAVSTKTLVVVGARDEGWLEPSRKLAALIEGSRLLVLDGAGHLAHLEQPDVCAEALQPLLGA